MLLMTSFSFVCSVGHSIVRSGMVNVFDLQNVVVKIVAQTNSIAAIDFAVTFVRQLALKEQMIPLVELAPLLECLSQVAQLAQQRRHKVLMLDTLSSLLDDVRTVSASCCDGTRARTVRLCAVYLDRAREAHTLLLSFAHAQHVQEKGQLQIACASLASAKLPCCSCCWLQHLRWP